MNAKLSNFSELSNILSVKSSLRTNLMSLFTRFGLGHLLCRMSLEKTGYGIEQISRVFDYVQGKCILGFKLLVCAFFDSTI